MVNLTDAHSDTLSLVGTGRLTESQVSDILDIFTMTSDRNDASSMRHYRYGSLDNACLDYNAYVQGRTLNLFLTHATTQDTIEALVRGFVWGDAKSDLVCTLTVGYDDFDYVLNYRTDDHHIWGSICFKLSRKKIEFEIIY
jgi:hypothetical protein